MAMLRYSLKIASLAGCVLAAAALASCQQVPPAPRALMTSTVTPYRLDSGDQLRITVFDQPGMTGTYEVDQAGVVSFPLIGSVDARGRTLPQLENTIASKLSKGFVRSPDVSIQVDRYRSIYIMGEVGQPGQYTYVPGMTAQNAIAAAGGFTPRANEKNIDLSRRIDGRTITGRVPVTDLIKAGDTIDVRERLF